MMNHEISVVIGVHGSAAPLMNRPMFNGRRPIVGLGHVSNRNSRLPRLHGAGVGVEEWDGNGLGCPSINSEEWTTCDIRLGGWVSEGRGDIARLHRVGGAATKMRCEQSQSTLAPWW